MATTSFHDMARDRLLHVAVGLGQIALAFYFTLSAVVKLLLGPSQRVEIMPWSEPLPPLLVLAFGTLELMLAVAVVLPAVTRGPQRVVGYAALACLTLLGAGVAVHVLHGELRMAVVSALAVAVAGFVAWGRLVLPPIDGTPV